MSIIAPSALVIRHQTYDLARSFSDSDMPGYTALQNPLSKKLQLQEDEVSLDEVSTTTGKDSYLVST
jgi:hypothetical protein